MPFQSGSISYARFRVEGDASQRIDTPLLDAMAIAFGDDRIVSIEWDRVEQATTTTVEATTTTIVTDEEQLAADVETIVDQWLADLGPDAAGRRVRRLLADPDAYATVAPAVGDLVLVPDPREPARLLVKRVAEVHDGGRELIVAGDARDASTDSRAFGSVTASTVQGRPWFRYWPLRRIGRVR